MMCFPSVGSGVNSLPHVAPSRHFLLESNAVCCFNQRRNPTSTPQTASHLSDGRVPPPDAISVGGSKSTVRIAPNQHDVYLFSDSAVSFYFPIIQSKQRPPTAPILPHNHGHLGPTRWAHQHFMGRQAYIDG